MMTRQWGWGAIKQGIIWLKLANDILGIMKIGDMVRL